MVAGMFFSRVVRLTMSHPVKPLWREVGGLAVRAPAMLVWELEFRSPVPSEKVKCGALTCSSSARDLEPRGSFKLTDQIVLLSQ